MTKYLLLSFSIIIAAIILSPERAAPKEGMVRTAAPAPDGHMSLNVESNSADVTYHTKTTLKKGTRLQIVLSNGGLKIVSGKNIVSNFFHLGRVLTVNWQDEHDGNQFFYANNPISWEVIP